MLASIYKAIFTRVSFFLSWIMNSLTHLKFKKSSLNRGRQHKSLSGRNIWLRSMWEKTLSGTWALSAQVHARLYNPHLPSIVCKEVSQCSRLSCVRSDFAIKFEWLWRDCFAIWSRNISPASPQFLNECLLLYENIKELFRQEKLMIKFGGFIFDGAWATGMYIISYR